MTQIVLALDDNPHAEQLVEWTAEFVAEEAAGGPSGPRESVVHVVHVVHRSELWMLASVMIDSTAYLDRLRQTFERRAIAPLRAHRVRADVTIGLGNPAHEIARIARCTRADVIVVGAVAHPWPRPVAGTGLGTRLARLGGVPVRIVPHD